MKIRDALAGLEFETEVPDGDLVSGAVVLVHTVSADDGREFLTISSSEGMGAFTQLGIVCDAMRIVNRGDDDD